MGRAPSRQTPCVAGVLAVQLSRAGAEGRQDCKGQSLILWRGLGVRGEVLRIPRNGDMESRDHGNRPGGHRSWGVLETLVVTPEPVGTPGDRISDAVAAFAQPELSRAICSSVCAWPLAHPSQTAAQASICKQPGSRVWPGLRKHLSSDLVGPCLCGRALSLFWVVLVPAAQRLPPAQGALPAPEGVSASGSPSSSPCCAGSGSAFLQPCLEPQLCDS